MIPDIYRLAKADRGWIQLAAANVKKGERVKFIMPTGATVILPVLDATPQGFRVELPNVSEVFVYGREVSDLRTVDYDAIAMLNVSATQAMYQQLNDLRARHTDSETALVELKARNAALEARLAAIETVLKSLKPTPQAPGQVADKTGDSTSAPHAEAGK